MPRTRQAQPPATEETVQTYTCRDCETEPVDNHGELCETCRDESYFNCGYCDDLTHNDDGNSTESHGAVCLDCLSTRFRTCYRCEHSYHRNRMVHSDSRLEYFCQDCYDNDPDPDDDNDSSDCDRVHDYSHRPEAIFHGDKGIERGYTVKREEYTSYYGSIGHRDAYIPTKTRYFGVELECNSEDKDDDSSFTLKALNGDLTNERHAYLKEDGSIDGGFEIVTHPHTLKAQRALWQKFFSGMPRSGFTSYKSGNCGMHVHVSRGSLKHFQRRRIIVFLHSPENLTYVETIAQRTSNHYSQIIPNKKISTPFPEDRYEAYNTTNCHTDEFRLFRGTTRKDRFFKNLEFCDALIDFCAETPYSGLSYLVFVNWVSKRANKYRYLHNYHIEKHFANGVPLKHSADAPKATVADTAA